MVAGGLVFAGDGQAWAPGRVGEFGAAEFVRGGLVGSWVGVRGHFVVRECAFVCGLAVSVVDYVHRSGTVGSLCGLPYLVGLYGSRRLRLV